MSNENENLFGDIMYNLLFNIDEKISKRSLKPMESLSYIIVSLYFKFGFFLNKIGLFFSILVYYFLDNLWLNLHVFFFY